MSRKVLAIAAALAACALASVSCLRDPIVYATSDYYLQLKEGSPWREDVNLEDISRVWAVSSYVDGKRTYEMYVTPYQHPKGMPYGGYLTGFMAGNQTLLVYNYDISKLRFDMLSNLDKIRAYTDVLDYSNGVAVVTAPGPVYVYREEVNVPFITKSEGTYYIDAPVTELTQTWRVIVRGVRNVHNIALVDFFLSGQQRGCFLGKDEPWDDRALIYFVGEVVDATWEHDGMDKEVLATYSTFGVYTGAERVMLTVRITGTNGYQYFVQKDVTDIVADPAGNGYTIYVDGSEVEVADKTDGGFNPQAEEWDPDVTKIELE